MTLKEKLKATKNNLLGATNTNDSLWNDFWDVITKQSSIWKTSRVLNALPGNQTLLDEAFFRNGGAGKQHLQRSIRDISWLEEHGQCMDNIKVGQSNIPDVGRGAFADRFIPKGDLVAPSPLIHVESGFLKMFQPMVDKAKPGMVVTPDLDGPMTYQLLLVSLKCCCQKGFPLSILILLVPYSNVS
jgi:hypothetical protein